MSQEDIADLIMHSTLHRLNPEMIYSCRNVGFTLLKSITLSRDKIYFTYLSPSPLPPGQP